MEMQEKNTKLCFLTSDIQLIYPSRVRIASLNVRIRGGAGWGRLGSRLRVHSPPFFREIIEIESLASLAAILDECMKPRRPLVPVSKGAGTGHTTPSFNLCKCEKNVYTMQMEPMIFYDNCLEPYLLCFVTEQNKFTRQNKPPLLPSFVTFNFKV